MGVKEDLTYVPVYDSDEVVFVPELYSSLSVFTMGVCLVLAGIASPWIGPVISGLGFFTSLLSFYCWSCFATNHLMVDIARKELHKIYGGVFFLALPALVAAIVGAVIVAVIDDFVTVKIVSGIGFVTSVIVCFNLFMHSPNRLARRAPNAAKIHEEGNYNYWYDRTEKSWFLVRKSSMVSWKKAAKKFGSKAEIEQALESAEIAGQDDD